MSSTVFGVAYDAAAAAVAARFWAAALGRTVVEAAAVASSGPRLAFHKVPEGKTVKNRVHFDLITADFDRELDRLVRLGATKLHEIDAGAHWVTLADPEGNEFDLIKG